MTETQREAFEAYFLDSRKSKHKPNFARLEDGTYADDHTQRHWWTWQQAALTQPQAQQAKTCHDSDCSVHNEPAYPAGPCDCGFEAQQAAAVPAGLLEPHVVEAAALAYEMSPCHDLIGPMEDALRAAIAAAPPAPVLPLSAWQPIETAPKDGSHILLFCQDSSVKIGGGYWFAKKNCWVHGGYMRRLSDPTHWQPLPATPITEPGAGGEG